MYNSLSGQSLGKYELRDLLGKGGMGAVYRAYDHLLSREVAVKVVTLNSIDGDSETRFIREAKTAAGLEHSHIVRVYDYGIDRGIHYVVMQNLTGGSLSERVQQAVDQGRPRPSLGEVSEMLTQLASALDYAHLQGVVHRDIKPQNIMFDRHGQAFIVDFGIAKLLSDATNLTAASMAMGTPSYMPPEQWSKQNLSASADQYALAVTIYQLVAGRLPFEAESVPALWYKIENEQPTPLNLVRADVPQSLMLVMGRAMAKNSADRFPNCTQFAQAFASSVSGVRTDTTNYFTFKLQKKQLEAMQTPIVSAAMTPVQPISSGAQPPQSSVSYAVPLPQSGQQPPRNNRMIYGIAAALVAVLILFAILLSGGRGSSDAEMTLIAVNSTLIAVSSGNTPDATINAVIQIIPSNTPQPTHTDVLNTDIPPSETPEPSPTETATITPSETPTLTATPSHTLTATFTETPSETPSHTPTPTPSHTPTETLTATPSPTATDTATSTNTLVPSPTNTTPPTNTATWTATRIFTPTPLVTVSMHREAIAGISSNPDWWPQEEDFDGVPMVLVPAGCFVIGSSTGDRDEADGNKICFDDPFWIDKTEVTQALFNARRGVAESRSFFRNESNPVEQITWFEAQNFCAKRIMRLPTEAEWEYAARGPSGYTYPWGNEFVADYVVYGENSRKQTEPVGSRTSGASWVGALDMSGNVWEWTSSLYLPYPYLSDVRYNTTDNARVLRGGSWVDSFPNGLRSANRLRMQPNLGTSEFGFRCVRPYDPNE